MKKYLQASSNTPHHQEIYSNPTSPTTNSINSNARGHRVSSSDSSACKKSRIPVNHTRIPSLSAPQSPHAVANKKSHIPTPTTNGSSFTGELL